MSREAMSTKTIYNRFADRWSNTKTNSFYNEQEFRRILKHWPKCGTIIDIGCAHGITVPLFLGIGRHLSYYGLDSSTALLKMARRRYPQLPFTLADISSKRNLPNKRFDGFWMNAVLMHLPYKKWKAASENIQSLCKKGSYGYISLPFNRPEGKMTDERHFTILTETEQKSFFRECRWRIVSHGRKDSPDGENKWNWYIVQLPK